MSDKELKKSILYTGGGDDGATSLIGGVRVAKTHPRLCAYGTIDELNSFIGLLMSEITDEYELETLQFVQNCLFEAGAYLADDSEKAVCNITQETVQRIERAIDFIDGNLPRMKGFVLPGGCRSAALAHVCRTVCRRAEREICRLSVKITLDSQLFVFINRLSDLLFAIARNECMLKNKTEIIWQKSCS